MPSTSKKQHNFMAMIANDPKKAKKLGVPQSVGKEFTEADKGKKFGASGTGREDLQKANVKKTDHGQTTLFKKGGKTMATKKLFGGKETFKEELNEAKAIKSGKITPMQYAKGEESEKKMKKMACGGKVKTKRYNGEEGSEVELESKTGENESIGDDVRARAMKAIAEGGQKDEAAAKPKAKTMSFKDKAKKAGFTSAETKGGAALMTRKMAKGGKVRGCGIAQKGLTKGKIV